VTRQPILRRPLAAFATALLLTTTAGCAGSSLDNDDRGSVAGGPIRIGLMWPQSGILKTVGDDFDRGWKLYLLRTRRRGDR
jgi:branched-chain amino acid transport system substrate-binding protein